MEKSSPALRDFVYLDWERVRSLAAQLLQGIPQDATTQQDRTYEGKVAVEASAPFLFKGQVGGDMRLFRSEKETRSFHHYIYTLVEEKLQQTDRITEVTSKYDFDAKWREGFFRDGQFVRVTGLVRLMDYAWVSSMMEALPKMLRVAQHAQERSLEQRRSQLSPRDYDKEKARLRGETQSQMKEIADLRIDEITG